MDITGANAVFTLSISDLFPAPVQLQGFATDDAWATNPLESVETLMGVDGQLSGGFVYVAVDQDVSLQADSASNELFDQWWAQMQQQRAVFVATGVITMPSISTKWFMTKGFLRRYQPMPAVKKLLQPRRYGILWESVSPGVAVP